MAIVAAPGLLWMPSQAPDALIFDLDGTLWDTCAACARAWNQSLAALGIAGVTIQTQDIRQVAGLPHADCIAQIFAALPAEQQAALITHTARSDLHAIQEWGGHLYPGVVEGIKALSQLVPLFVVSNCQAGYIELFLAQAQLHDYFVDHLCWGDTNQSKAQNLMQILVKHQLREAVYIGDTAGDAEAAAACDLSFWFASWGFGRPASYDYSLSAFGEIHALLTAQR